MKDPIVEGVRKHRMEHTKKFKGDLAEICADLRAVQAACGLKVVSLTSKKPPKAKKAL